MAFQTVWYFSDLSPRIIDIIEEDLSEYDSDKKKSTIAGNVVNQTIRRSENAWIPTNHWVGGFLWHYIMKANRENFLYDLTAIDDEQIQYTIYEEGSYYNWHIDAGISSAFRPEQTVGSSTNKSADISTVQGEYQRKLSFVVQLSDPSEYRGGELQLMGDAGDTYFAPKVKGTVILFDSRTPHRVRKIKSGSRRSLVGWVVGPRWK